MLLPKGVFITQMPRAVAALTSMLSTPMPARPMTFRFLAAARTSGVTLLAERKARPSNSPIMAASSFGFMPVFSIDLDAAFLEDLHGSRGQLVGNKNLGHDQASWRSESHCFSTAA